VRRTKADRLPAKIDEGAAQFVTGLRGLHGLGIMNSSLPKKEPEYDAQCLVCFRSVRPDDGMVHFPFDERIVTLCCPLCYEAFRIDPQRYLGRKVQRPPRK